MLEHVLAHPSLRSLKGAALEVDTKSIEQIVMEFTQAQQRFGERVRVACESTPLPHVSDVSSDTIISSPADVEPCREAIDILRRQYENYARVVGGGVNPSQIGLPSQWLEPDSLAFYRQTYLPHEILHWGGDVQDMFPGSCRDLAREGVELSTFVDFWFREPEAPTQAYDFFLLKLDRFPEFVQEVFPAAYPRAKAEADSLRAAYLAACNPVVQPHEARS
jgi:hypothetical protein